MSLLKVKQLRAERVELVKKAQALMTDNMTAEQAAQVDAILADADKKQVEIERWEKLMAMEAALQERVEMRAGLDSISPDEQQERQRRYARAFATWMRGGMETLQDADRKLLLSQAGFAPSIYAAQGVGTPAAGGFLVPQEFSDRLEVALKFWGGMLSVAEVLETASGADLPWPTVNDTTQLGAILTENTAISAQDMTFGSVTLKAYMYTSKLIAVSFQLMQDSFFSIENLVADIAGQRLGRILNLHFTTGDGAAKPTGIVTAAALGKTGATGQTTSVIYDDLVDLMHAVDPAYRPGAKWMMHDATIRVIRKLKDTQGRPLWEPSLQAGQPDTLLGYPIVVNNDVPVMAANAKSILFGALDKYKVRQVKGVTLLRLNERYADNLQVGFFAFARYDGNLIDAGTNPVKYYANSAS
jgi:HK97 family phage major capsid protein